MDTVDAVRKAVDASGKSMRAVSEELGRSSNYVYSSLEQSARKGGGLHSATLAGIAGVCGYSLALVPKGKEPPGSLVIDPSNNGHDE